MTPKEFNAAVLQLWGSVYAGGPRLGLSLRQTQRYCVGDKDPPDKVAHQIQILQFHIDHLKRERESLLAQLAFFEQGGIIRTGNHDETADWVAELQRRLAELESLLREHPAGLIPQI